MTKNKFKFLIASTLVLLANNAVAQTPAKKPAQVTASVKAPSLNLYRAADPENLLMIETTKGNIIVELAPQIAPNHVARVKELTRANFYNGLVFHRVIDTFMAQTGDPKGDGSGGSPLPDLGPEFSFRRGSDIGFVSAVARGGAQIGWVGSIPVTSQLDALMSRTVDKKVTAWINHCPAVASMARSDAENSANSQFFLMRQSYPSLDRRYTAWGRVISGLEVVRSLKTGEPVLNPDVMNKVYILADVPEAQRQKVFIERFDSPEFKTKLNANLTKQGAAFSNCEITPDVKIVN